MSSIVQEQQVCITKKLCNPLHFINKTSAYANRNNQKGRSLKVTTQIWCYGVSYLEAEKCIGYSTYCCKWDYNVIQGLQWDYNVFRLFNILLIIDVDKAKDYQYMILHIKWQSISWSVKEFRKNYILCVTFSPTFCNGYVNVYFPTSQ